jgi:hypothetical protein
MLGYDRFWIRKRWCGVVLTSLSDLGQVSIHTSAFRYLTLQSGGEKYGCF